MPEWDLNLDKDGNVISYSYVPRFDIQLSTPVDFHVTTMDSVDDIMFSDNVEPFNRVFESFNPKQHVIKKKLNLKNRVEIIII